MRLGTVLWCLTLPALSLAAGGPPELERRKNMTDHTKPQPTAPGDDPSQARFMPADTDRGHLSAWFAAYDARTRAGDLEGMASMVLFPLAVVTDDSRGEGHAEAWTREEFLETMAEATKGTPPDLELRSERTPFYLTDDLVVVATEATMTFGGQQQTMRYVDILVKRDGTWLLQTMAQGGWGNLLKARRAKASAGR